ncbi:LCP family protein [Pseudonocardia saturnea]
MDERLRPRRDRTGADETPWPRRSERERAARDPSRRDAGVDRATADRASGTGRPVPPRRRPGTDPVPIEEPTRPVAPHQRAPRDRGTPERGTPARVAPGRGGPARPGTPGPDPTQEPTTVIPARAPAFRRPPVDGEDLRTRPVPRTPKAPPAAEPPAPRVPAADPARPARAAAAATGTPAPKSATKAPGHAKTTGAGSRRPTAPPVKRRGRRRPRTLGRALLTTAAATVAPGSGHLMLHRRRTGWLILGPFLLVVVALTGLVLTQRRSDLLTPLVSSGGLAVATTACVLAALGWVAVIVRTWVIAQPRRLDTRQRAVGLVAVTALCLVVAAPLGFAANLANSSRGVLGDLFADDAGSAAALGPRVNLLLVGSDAGPDRTGTRTDTMMVASIDTATGRTTLFSLPRNIENAQFPPGSAMAEEFPDGFADSSGPAGNYYLNAVYAYAHEYPAVAPPGPTDDVGLNLLHQTVSYMLGLDLDYYVELDMAGFAAIIDSLGGLQVDVGPERIPIGGISPTGREVRPTGYIEPGLQQLSGENALAFARSRTNSTDYVRMGRQRCLIQGILDQNQPAELLANFQSIAQATTDSVSTNIPQQALPALLSIADAPLQLESVAFDPNLPDPDQPDGRFNTGDPDFDLMREVVQAAITRDPAAAPPVAAADPSDIPETNRADEDDTGSTSGATADADATDGAPLTATPVPVAQSC